MQSNINLVLTSISASSLSFQNPGIRNSPNTHTIHSVAAVTDGVGEGVVWFGLPVRGEAYIEEHLLHLLLCAAQRLDLGVHKRALDAAQVGLLSLDAGLHKTVWTLFESRNVFTELLAMACMRMVFPDFLLPSSPHFFPRRYEPRVPWSPTLVVAMELTKRYAGSSCQPTHPRQHSTLQRGCTMIGSPCSM